MNFVADLMLLELHHNTMRACPAGVAQVPAKGLAHR